MEVKSKKSKSKSKAFEEKVIETDQNPKGLKRVKKTENEVVVNEKPEDNEKQLFQRVWSEDDEIVVLEGLIEFRRQSEIDPATNMTSFLEFIKGSLHFDASLSQLKDKVYKLKKKTIKNLSKGKVSLTNPHDQKVFNLAKKIWVGDNGAIEDGIELSFKSTGKIKIGGNKQKRSVVDVGVDEPKEDAKMVLRLEDEGGKNSSKGGVAGIDKVPPIGGDIEDYVIKSGLDMVDIAIKGQLETEWKKLHVAELELFVQKNEVLIEQAKLMLKAYENED